MADKLDPFQQKPGVLLDGSRTMESDAATGTDDPVPRERVGRVSTKEPGDGTVVKRIACGGRDFAIGADTAYGNGENNAAESVVPQLACARTVAKDATFDLRRGVGDA